MTQILRRLDNPYIIKLLEIYEDESNIFIVSELINGEDLKAKINEIWNLDERNISDIIWKLLNALNHLHRHNIVHRDIKLENIYYRNPKQLTEICIINFCNSELLDCIKIQ